MRWPLWLRWCSCRWRDNRVRFLADVAVATVGCGRCRGQRWKLSVRVHPAGNGYVVYARRRCECAPDYLYVSILEELSSRSCSAAEVAMYAERFVNAAGGGDAVWGGVEMARVRRYLALTGGGRDR